MIDREGVVEGCRILSSLLSFSIIDYGANVDALHDFLH